MRMFVLLLSFLLNIIFSIAIPVYDDDEFRDKYYDYEDDVGIPLWWKKPIETKYSGFTVILLNKASGRFLGMGGIIDSKTVLTSNNVVRTVSGQPDQILLMGGYRSPWWGKSSGMRSGNQVLANKFGIALIETTPPWRFNNGIYPLDIAQSQSVPDRIGLMVYGLRRSANYKSGNPVPEKFGYDTVVHTVDKRGKCGEDYSDMKSSFDESIHFCLHPNGSFCAGAVGSMVVAMGKRNAAKEIIGIVFRSSCKLRKRQLVVVKVSSFFNWIKFNSFLV